MTREELCSKLRPITDGLFGEQWSRPYERPHFQVRALGVMLEDLAGLGELEWRGYAFSREPLNGKFDDGQRLAWMGKSLACGEEYADKVCGRYGTRDPEELAAAMEMRVSYRDYPEKADRVLFAEFREPDTICVYLDAVRRAGKLQRRPEVAGVLGEGLDIARLLLAHELFHAVEERHRHEIFTKTEKVRLWSVGPLHNDSQVIALSEIAAMGFAKAVMGIGYSPYLMDVFLVYGYSPEEASGLYEEMMACAGRRPRPL